MPVMQCTQAREGPRVTVAVGVLVHNVFRYHRHELFRRTVRSLADQNPDQLFIVSNGSDDGTQDYVRDLGGLVVNDPVSSCGHGMNVTINATAAAGCEFTVFSNDDIDWKPGSLVAMCEFLAAAPADLVLISGLLEDDYPWNTVYERVEYGGHIALIRRTAPGGCWGMRTSDWAKIRPVPESPGYDDVPACERLGKLGYRVAQLDLCEHIGTEASTWGNGSAAFGKPLDREFWRI